MDARDGMIFMTTPNLVILSPYDTLAPAVTTLRLGAAPIDNDNNLRFL